MGHSCGMKQCLRCGDSFQTDLRGGAKWCFPCKDLMRREYHKHYRRNRKSRSDVEKDGAVILTK